MANVTETLDGGLLWLRLTAAASRSSTGKIAALEQVLSSSARPVQTVSDVYHALLYLIRGGVTAYPAAIVCVDEMEQAELEFFTLLSQQHHCPPVYVYGHERSLSKLGRAIELGATGEANHEVVQQLVRLDTTPEVRHVWKDRERPTVATEPESSGTREVATWESEDVEPILADDAIDVATSEPAPSDGDAEIAHAGEDDDTETPVRVPWRSYDDTGRRSPPRRSPPPHTSPHVGTADANRSRPEPYEPGPLLSEEELRALIGDDDAATGDTNTDTHGS